MCQKKSDAILKTNDDWTIYYEGLHLKGCYDNSLRRKWHKTS